MSHPQPEGLAAETVNPEVRIPDSEYRHRRDTLMEQLPKSSVVVIASHSLTTRSNDTEYPFRQQSDFWYLTGFNEPDAMLVMSNLGLESGSYTSTLFCQPKDPLAEIWQGRRLGAEAAPEALGLNQAFANTELATGLVNLLDQHQQLFFALGDSEAIDQQVLTALSTLRSAPKQSKIAPLALVDVRPILHEMRLHKSDAEIAVMQQAANISVNAHHRAMRHSRPGLYEYQLEAEIQHEFAYNGARSPAYASIVGGGDNACILHYTENSEPLQDGDLVLIDAGAEFQGYASDITRTFPVNGRFSEPQKQLYELVLAAQEQAIAFFRPDVTLTQATDLAIKIITQGLIDLGILSGDLQQNIADKTYRQYFMHGLSHWLGLDVHDAGDYKVVGQDRPLNPGMVLTVEPGIYIAPDAPVDSQWQGIGIRIEDNVLITESGCTVLTQAAVKSIADIEALMSNGGSTN